MRGGREGPRKEPAEKTVEGPGGAPGVGQPETGEEPFEQNAEKKTFRFPEYRKVDEEEIIWDMPYYNVPLIVSKILRSESPLSEEWLLRRIVFVFDRTKVTNVVRKLYSSSMRDCSMYGIKRRDGFVYLKDEPVPMLRVPSGNAEPRAIEHIAAEELANGMREVIRHNVACDRDGLFRLLTNQLGFSHMGDRIEAHMERALELLRDEIETDGSRITLKKRD